MRRQKKISAKQLGGIIGTGGSFVGNVENQSNPAKYNLKHLYLVATYFGISPKDFLPE